jgi:hypothetical protein
MDGCRGCSRQEVHRAIRAPGRGSCPDRGHASRLTEGPQPTGPSGPPGRSIAINATGMVVGRSAGQSSGATDWRTVVWNPGAAGGYGEPLDLDCPAMQLYPAINSGGDIVANECRGHYSPPCLWIRNGAEYDDPVGLGVLGGRGSTHATGIDIAGGWQAGAPLRAARDEPCSGTRGWIVGSAWNKSGRVAVLWRPR